MKGGTEPFLNAKNVSCTILENAATVHLYIISQPQQLLQTQHNQGVQAIPFSFILLTPLSLSPDQATKQVYTSHIHQHVLYAIRISFTFLSALS